MGSDWDWRLGRRDVPARDRGRPAVVSVKHGRARRPSRLERFGVWLWGFPIEWLLTLLVWGLALRIWT